MFRYNYSSRHFIIPVVLYSVFYNIPKFFELTTSCSDQQITSHLNNTSLNLQVDFNQSQSIGLFGGCPNSTLQLVATDIRINYWYLNIYVLWMNTILNILFPIISLIVLNILICRYI